MNSFWPGDLYFLTSTYSNMSSLGKNVHATPSRRTIELTDSSARLPSPIAVAWPQATAADFDYLDFLQVLREGEISCRATVSLARRPRRA